MSLKLGHVGSKPRSPGQILEKSCIHTKGHIFSLMIMKLVQNVCLDESQTSSKMGHVKNKTRSVCQILEKPYVHSRVHIFSPIIMKLGQNVCLDKVSDEFENGSCRSHVGSKSRSLRQIMKTLCTL